MSKIDTSIWITQQAFATELQAKTGEEISIQRVHNWVKRNKLQSRKLEGSSLVLVNRNSLKIKLKGIND